MAYALDVANEWRELLGLAKYDAVAGLGFSATGSTTLSPQGHMMQPPAERLLDSSPCVHLLPVVSP